MWLCSSITCIQRLFLAPEKEGLEGLGPREGGLLKSLVVERCHSANSDFYHKKKLIGSFAGILERMNGHCQHCSGEQAKLS